MRISARKLIFFSLIVIFYTALGGAQYFLGNRLQELGILFSLVIFIYGALVASLNCRENDLAWNRWIFGSVIFLCFTFILPGYLWGNYNHVSILPSIASSREFLISILAAGIYFICRSGFDIKDIEKAFYTALGIICVSYLIFRYTFDLRSMLNNPDPHVNSLVADGHRGLRLRPPTKALICLLIVSPINILNSRETRKKLLWLTLMLAAAWAIWIQQGRSMMAGILFGIVCYNLFWSRRHRLNLFVFAFPVMVVLFISFNAFMLQKLSTSTDGDAVRWDSIQTAIGVIKNYPLLGIGKSSGATVTDTDLFGDKFYPSDIGLFGVAYKFGLLGLFIYVTFLLFLIYKTININLIHRKFYHVSNPLLVAALINFVNDVVFCLFTAHLTFIGGLTLAALVLGTSASHISKLKRGHLV